MISGEHKKSSKFEIGQEVKDYSGNRIEPFDDDSYISKDTINRIREDQAAQARRKKNILDLEDYSSAEDENPVERKKSVPDINTKIEGIQIITNEPFPELRTLIASPNQADKPKGQIEIIVTQEVLLETFRHVSTDVNNELGGFLLGNRFQCPNSNRKYIIIDQYLEAPYTEGTSVSLTFKEESFAQLAEFLSGKFRGKELVGWYHSHPNMSIFLSSHDAHIQKSLFSRIWDVALVLDPVKNEGGFFTWSDEEAPRLHKNENMRAEFYEWLTDGTQRESVIAWTNHTVNDPKLNQKVELKEINTGNYRQETSILQLPAGKTDRLSAMVTNLPETLKDIENELPVKYSRYILLTGTLVTGLILAGIIYAGFLGIQGWFSQNNGNSPVQTNGQVPEEINQPSNENLDVVKNSFNNLNLIAEKGWVDQKNQKLQIVFNLKGKGVNADTLKNFGENIKNVVINNEEGTIISQNVEGYTLRLTVETSFISDSLQKFKAGKNQKIKVNLPFVYSGQFSIIDYPLEYSNNYSKAGKPSNSDLLPIFFGQKPIITKPKNITVKANKNNGVAQPVQAVSNKTQTNNKSNNSENKKQADSETNLENRNSSANNSNVKSSSQNEKGKKGNERKSEIIKGAMTPATIDVFEVLPDDIKQQNLVQTP